MESSLGGRDSQINLRQRVAFSGLRFVVIYTIFFLRFPISETYNLSIFIVFSKSYHYRGGWPSSQRQYHSNTNINSFQPSKNSIIPINNFTNSKISSTYNSISHYVRNVPVELYYRGAFDGRVYAYLAIFGWHKAAKNFPRRQWYIPLLLLIVSRTW